MAEINFKSLQNWHERLLQKQSVLSDSDKQAFVKEVREFIEQAKSGGSFIPSNRDRDQLRANLRYWANYLYNMDGAFPDTELAPSIVKSRSIFESGPVLWTLIIVIGGTVLLSFFLFNNRTLVPETTPTPPGVSETIIPTIMEQPINTEQAPETPTPQSSGFNVVLSSPVNGDFITPNIEFKGTFDNLKSGWAIHVLFIEGGRYFPVKEVYTISDKPESNEWMIETQLTETPEVMGRAQSYSIVLAVSINESSRELLSNSSETGIEINSLPDTVIQFDDTARVIYRDPFKVVRETRLLYSFHDGLTYDIYASKTDGSDPIQITSTTNIHERDPQLSPDGRHIVYVKYFVLTNTFAIHIMDSNGENDREIINSGRNVLENPQWSPDSSYISYALGEVRESSNRAFWSISTYHMESGEIRSISRVPAIQVNRYASWIPNTSDLVFDAAVGDRTRFVRASMDSQEHSVFFDPGQYVIQPSITALGNGYLLVYTIIGPAPNYLHDIYAAVDLDVQDTFDGDHFLLIQSGGEVVDYPQVDLDANTLYYTRNGAILRVKIQVEGSQITLIREANTGPYGELVIAAGPTREAIHFDVNYMDAFFPIQ
jgi:hypothetical protein